MVAKLQTAIAFVGRKVCRLFLLGLAVGIALSGVELAFAYSLQGFLQALGILGNTGIALPRWVPQGSFLSVMLFFFAVGAARSLLQWSQVYLQGRSGEELLYLLRNRILHWAMHSTSVNSGRVVTLLTDRAYAAANCAQHVQTVLIQLSCGALLGMSLLVIAPTLTFLSFCVLLVFLLPMKSFDKKIEKSGKAVGVEGEALNRQLLVCIKNLLFVQLYGMQDREERLARERSANMRAHHLTYSANMALKFALPQFAGLILICIIAYTVRTHIAIEPAKLISFLYLFGRFTQTISSGAQTSSTLLHYRSQVFDMVNWWIENKPDESMSRRAGEARAETEPVPSPVGWELKNVSFAYPNADMPTLQSLNLRVKPGACLVIIGPSGVGKSTLLNIMLGGLQPQKGEVNISLGNEAPAVPLAKVRASLLGAIGYVGPESFLIEDTIFGNLVYGLSEAPSEARVIEACKKAGCQFVFDLPKGLRHVLTEQGQGLSAGQKQRLSLARALLRNPKVLILDEATSNLDHETEEKIVKLLADVKGQTTVIAVTHRQALLRIADEELQLKGSPAV